MSTAATTAAETEFFTRYQLMVAHCASHPRLREAMTELASPTDAPSDPKAFLMSKGFNLPADSVVKLERRDATTDAPGGLEISICITGLPGHHAACVVFQPPIDIIVT